MYRVFGTGLRGSGFELQGLSPNLGLRVRTEGRKPTNDPPMMNSSKTLNKP